MKLNKNERGFSSVEILMVVVIVGLIGFAGWLVYKNHTKPTPKVITVTKTVTTPAKVTTTPSTTQISNSAVDNLLTSFYNQYTACIMAGNLNKTCTNSLVAKYGTAKLASYYKPASGYSYPADPIECAQETPSSVTVANIVTTTNNATATVVEGFKPPVNINISLVTDNSGNLLIDSVACNPPLVASPGSP